jgi:hypothetical protein
MHPEDAKAKPVMMRIIKTALDSFIHISITAVSNKPCGNWEIAVVMPPPAQIVELLAKDDLCYAGSSVRIKGISESFTLTVAYVNRG